MKRSFFARVLLWGAAGSLICSPLISAESESPQKNVLLLYDARSDMLGNIVVDRVIRSSLNKEFGMNVDVRSEYFEVSSQPDQDYRALFGWLSHRYAEIAFDIVVAVGSNALDFVSNHGDELF